MTATDGPEGVREPEAAFVAPWTDGDDGAPPIRRVVLDLDEEAAALLDDLMARGHRDVSDLVGWALGAYWRELEGIVLPPPAEGDMDEVIRQSEEDIRAGRIIPQDELFERLRLKYAE